MWKRIWTVGIGVIAAVGAVSAQGSSPSDKRDVVIVIGCLESAQGGYVLTDNRSSVRYRVDAPADTLNWHVGHELEIHGTFQSGGATPTLKAESVVYISQTCSKASGGKG
ncbi:MAG: hypothetical protein GEU82_09315 [Luteitalea sp.]|nr:hypothetical protein [Luteitalea sp.]